MRADIELHDVAQIELSSEYLSSRWVNLVLELDRSSTLAFYFSSSPAGVAAWQQLRQGISPSSDYILHIDGKRVEGPACERAITEWLFAKSYPQPASKETSHDPE